MTHKHYNAIADTLRNNRPSKEAKHEYELWRIMVRDMTATVGQFSNHFNKTRFLSACGYED